MPLRPDPGIAVDGAEPDPDRTGVSASPLHRWPPQWAQNDFGNPSSGRHVRTASAPATTRSASGATIAFSDHGAPLRRWQRLQWQYPAVSNGAVTSNRTAPHAHAPVTMPQKPSRQTHYGLPRSRPPTRGRSTGGAHMAAHIIDDPRDEGPWRI